MSTHPEPKRIQLGRSRGWRKPEGAIVVSRPSRWGNPFRIVPDGSLLGEPLYRVVVPDGLNMRRFLCGQQTRQEAIGLAVSLYRDWINTQSRGENVVPLLRGHDLACWCPLVDAQGNRVPCHADVLLEIANAS